MLTSQTFTHWLTQCKGQREAGKKYRAKQNNTSGAGNLCINVHHKKKLNRLKSLFLKNVQRFEMKSIAF